MTATRDDRTLGDLFSELSQKTSTLITKEIELARLEITRSMTDMARSTAMVAAGGVVAYAGALIMLIGAAWLLATFGLPVWLAFVLVGGLTLAIGGFLAYRAINAIKQVNVVPERTVATIRDDVEWAKEQTQ